MFYQIIYTSRAAEFCQKEDVKAILEVAREKNAKLDITGLLIMVDNQFIQLLEGPRENVVQIFKTIKADKRHEEVRALLEQPATRRAFQDWSMAYMEKTPQDVITMLKAENCHTIDDVLDHMERTEGWVNGFFQGCRAMREHIID